MHLLGKDKKQQFENMESESAKKKKTSKYWEISPLKLEHDRNLIS